jgi:hypothetical protein
VDRVYMGFSFGLWLLAVGTRRAMSR